MEFFSVISLVTDYQTTYIFVTYARSPILINHILLLFVQGYHGLTFDLQLINKMFRTKFSTDFNHLFPIVCNYFKG